MKTTLKTLTKPNQTELSSINILTTLTLLIFMISTGIHIVPLQGQSMKPHTDHGDLAICNTNYNQIKEGDVISYQHPEQKHGVAHRIKKINNQTIQTKGDNNELPDPYQLTKKDVRCKITPLYKTSNIVQLFHTHENGFKEIPSF